MNINSMSGGNRMHGLFSGLETDKLVQTMMLRNFQKFNRMTQQRQLAEWRRDAYQDVNNTLRNFREEFASVLSKVNMASRASYQAITVNQKENAFVNITANSTARTGNHRIDKIDQLAEAATFRTKTLPNGAKTTVGEIMELPADSPQSFVRFQINGQDVLLQTTATVEDMVRHINSLNLGVTANFTELDNSFSITSNDTGAGESLKLNDSSGTFLNSLFAGGTMSVKDVDSAPIGLAPDFSGDGFTAQGQDAKLTINGIKVTRGTNQFTADGITYDLQGVTSNPVTFSIGRNTQGVIDAVKDMVSSFNTMVLNLAEQLSTRGSRNFQPLTEHQRENMSKEEIDKWEAEAVKGILHRDPTLQRLMTEMRSAISGDILGLGNMMSIGISTPRHAKEFTLEVDEVALRRALEEDPDRVASLFAANIGLNETRDLSKMGFMHRITDAIDRFGATTRDVQIRQLNRSIEDFANAMRDEKARLDRREAQLYARFTAMERMLSGMNAQAGWMASQMGGMQ